jgi:hypothetical protein
MMNHKDNTAPRSSANLIFLTEHIDRRRALELESLLTNDRNILKIMAEDVAQRIQFLQLQYQQLTLLAEMKQIAGDFVKNIPNTDTPLEPLIQTLKNHDLSVLSFSMNHALADCLDNVRTKPYLVGMPQVECILDDLFNLQDKKLLITELQLSKVEETIKLHYLHYNDMIHQAEENTHFLPNKIQQEKDILLIYQGKIERAFEIRKQIKKKERSE